MVGDMHEINLSIVDDECLFCDILKEYITFNIENVNISTFYSLSSYNTSKCNCDLLLLDLNLYGEDTIRFLENRDCNTKVVIMSNTIDQQLLEYIFSLRINGFIPKGKPKETFMDAFERILIKGEDYFCDPIFDSLRSNDKTKLLTSKEISIIKLLAIKNKIIEVAELLQLSDNTISNRISVIYNKLNINKKEDLRSFYFKYLA